MGNCKKRLKKAKRHAIVGEGYKAKASCMNGIDSIRRNAPEAAVVKEED